MCTIIHSDAFLALQAELQTERTWREELQFLTIDQAVEIGKLRAGLSEHHPLTAEELFCPICQRVRSSGAPGTIE